MKKETFIAAIEAIKKQYEHDKRCSEKLESVFPESRTATLMYDNHWLSNALISVLCEVMEDKSGWIEYYLWELDFGKENWRLKVTDKDGKNIPLSTPEDLYNLLMEEKNA